jgi:hypothetical protein
LPFRAWFKSSRPLRLLQGVLLNAVLALRLRLAAPGNQTYQQHEVGFCNKCAMKAIARLFSFDQVARLWPNVLIKREFARLCRGWQ